MGVLGSLRTLISFFTVIPIKGAPPGEAPAQLALVPVVGVIYGLLAGVTLTAAGLILPPLPSAAITLLAINALNGFLHMDGLVDFGDGLTTLGGREEKLRAMKDTRIGAGGASLAVLTVASVVTLYGSLTQRYAILSAFTVEVMCMNSILACACLGKPRGSGLGNMFVENVNWKTLLASSLISLLITSSLFYVSALLLSFTASLELAPLIPLSLATSLAAGFTVALLSNRVFGCVTGDVLGACHELSRIPLLVAALVVPLVWG